MRPVRVAQLVETLAAGGAEALAIDIAGEMASRGHVSDLFVVRGGGPFLARVGPDVGVVDLTRGENAAGQVERIAQFLGACRALERSLRQRRVEVLQTHLPKANFLGLMMARRGVCRVYATVHNNREFDYGDNAGAAKRALRRRGYKAMLGCCTGVVAVSEQVKHSLVEQLGADATQASRITVVPNGIRIRPPVTAEVRERARKRWGVTGDEVLIVGVGRLTRQKNFAALVEALEAVGGPGGRWRCIIAGDGELRGQLENLLAAKGLAAHVTLPGLVEDVPELLAAADVFCLPSAFEGLPLVLLEAMVAGLPVVAFTIDGVTDVVQDGVQASLAAPGDVGALGRALRNLVDDDVRRAALGQAGRATAESSFNMKSMMDRLEAIYGGTSPNLAGSRSSGC